MHRSKYSPAPLVSCGLKKSLTANLKEKFTNVGEDKVGWDDTENSLLTIIVHFYMFGGCCAAGSRLEHDSSYGTNRDHCD